MATWTQVAGLVTQSIQTSTEAAPASALDGCPLDGIGGFNLVAECEPGETFTGIGDLPCFLFDPASGWARGADPAFDLEIASAVSGNRRIVWTFPAVVPRGRIAHVCNAVGVTGGQVTLYYECTTVRGFRA